MHNGKIGAGLAVMIACACGPARAHDLIIPGLGLPLGGTELHLDGLVSATSFAPRQPGRDGLQAAGAVSLLPLLRRDYGDGLSLDLAATLTLSDRLSRDVYDGDVIERLAAEIHGRLGKLQIGITDGAGSVLALGGPQVQHDVSLNDPRTGFFRNPVTGGAVTNIFSLRTPVGASSNYAKFVYTSPEWSGATLALSYTPSEGKQLPFLNAGPHVAGRMAAVWEAGLQYRTRIGPVALNAYGAVAEGRGEHKLPGQEGIGDVGAGLRADTPLNDTLTFSLGGSWRQSNAYAFDAHQIWQGATTQGQHVSAMLQDGVWSAGLEYGNGVAGAVAAQGLPRLGLNGTQFSVGYQAGPSAQLTAGWQRQDYTRDSGVFFNGGNQLQMDAVYLHLLLKTVE